MHWDIAIRDTNIVGADVNDTDMACALAIIAGRWARRVREPRVKTTTSVVWSDARTEATR